MKTAPFSTSIIAFATLVIPALYPVTARAQAKPPASVVAGFPVNYDEALAGEYTLPDPLLLPNGKKIKEAKTWTTVQRPALVKLFEEQQFGKMPPRPADLHFDVFDKGTLTYDGKALRK